MSRLPRISLFIIAKNEEKKIAKCILSARPIVSEVIVVDSNSTDKTTTVCRTLGAMVYNRNFDGFTQQKNFALSKVTGDWALSLDADETLSPELAQEIKQAVQNEEYDGYLLCRVNDFWGKRMHHSGVKNEKLLRLVRTKKAVFEGGLVHEKLTVRGKVGQLKNVFVHDSFVDIETYINKLNHYTTLSAQNMYKKGKRCSIVLTVLRLPFAFLKRYVLQLGFLDGFRGFIWAVFYTFYTFVKYAKLWLLEVRHEQ